jgi:hypothetical protein
MKMKSSHIGATGDSSNLARINRLSKPPGIRYKRREDGKLVKLRRVRRKKSAEVTSLGNPSSASKGGRTQSTSEMEKAAPVQTKTNGVWTKKARYRTITPGTGNMVIKANPSDRLANPAEKRPLNTLDTVI